jgi:hypothetical protein
MQMDFKWVSVISLVKNNHNPGFLIESYQPIP